MKRKIISLVLAFMLTITLLPVMVQAITPSSQVSITIDDGVETAVPGTAQTYTIVVSNVGSENETGVGVNCTLPEEVTNLPLASWTVDSSSGGGSVVSGSPSSGNMAAITPPEESLMTAVDLPAGASVTFKLNANIRSSATGSISVTASILGGSATDTDTDILTPQADLSVTIGDDKESFAPGATTPYKITVTNNGPSNVVGANLSCPLPAGAATAYWGPDSYGQSGYANPMSGSGALASTVSLSKGASYTFWFTVWDTDPEATGSFSATATITPPSGVTDPTPGNNSATDTDTLTPQADLEVWVSFGDQTGNEPNVVTFNVGVRNQGPSVATGVTLSVPLPVGVTLVSATPDVGTYDASTGVWTVGTLGDYSLESLEMKATVDYSSAPQTVTASVAHSDHSDPDTSNDFHSLMITDRADIAVTTSVDNPTPNEGDTITITITVTNNGPNDATDVWVDALLPSGLAYVSDHPSTGYYNYNYDGYDDYGFWEVVQTRFLGRAGTEGKPSLH